jgi:hypothetical protein
MEMALESRTVADNIWWAVLCCKLLGGGGRCKGWHHSSCSCMCVACAFRTSHARDVLRHVLDEMPALSDHPTVV